MEQISQADLELLRGAATFDRDWYSENYRDVAKSGLDPAFHFLWIGWKLGRRPSAQANFRIDIDNYLAAYPDVAKTGIHPVAHYLAYGIAERRSLGIAPDAPSPGPIAAPISLPAQDMSIEAVTIRNSPLFDRKWYVESYPDVVSSGSDPITHFLAHAALGHDPSPYFSSAWYLENWIDVRSAGVNPLLHYLEHGHIEGRSPHPAFDTEWYRNRYLADSPHVEPAGHYLTIGQALGHRPYPLFDGAYYFDRYPDLRGAGIRPYEHWMKHGRAEGRQGIDPATLGDSLKVGVVAHVFYEDLWPQISRRLRAIPGPFGLVVTVSPGSQLAAAVRADWPEADVVETPNTGRDIAPFLRVLPLLLERGYDVVCKLHTKRGATEPDTWRHMLLEGVLGSPAQVRQILGWFEHDPDLATVGPELLYLNGPLFIYPKGAMLEDLFKRIEGQEALVPQDWGFFAGSMFWIRPQVLRGLIDADLLPLFEEDNSARDGQMAHYVERLFGMIAASRGRRVGLTDVSGTRATTAVDVRMAPHRTIVTDLAETLPAKSSELARRIPALKHRNRRTWLAPPGAKLGVTFVGPVEAVNGLGVSARGFVDAAIATGHPVHVVKWRPGFDRVRMLDVSYPTPGQQFINIVHLNLDLIYALRLHDPASIDRLLSPSRYNVVIISWELLAVNPAWVETIHLFDEVWAASTYMIRAMQSVSAIPARVVRPALNVASRAADGPLPFALPRDRTIFFYGADFGSVVKRKNPETFWRAYAAEFAPDDGAFCIMKLHYADTTHPLVMEITALAASRPDMLLITDSLSDAQMESLFARIDCYVSPHRAEGLGLTLLEAMLAGKPVIATGHSGESDFVRDDTALTVDYDLTEVGADAEPYMAGAVWADPHLASIRQRMRQVMNDRAAARAIGARGRERAIELFSLANTSARLDEELTRIWRNGGGMI